MLHTSSETPQGTWVEVYRGATTMEIYCPKQYKAIPCADKIKYDLWKQTFSTNKFRLEFHIEDIIRYVSIDAISLSGDEHIDNTYVTDELGHFFVLFDSNYYGTDMLTYQANDLSYFLKYGGLEGSANKGTIGLCALYALTYNFM
jgi:hypothetical protein